MNEWRSIDQEPAAPVQVELFYGNLSRRDANGNPRLHILAPHRDERRTIGFWDGERWYGMETGEDCFEDRWTHEQLPTHWRALPPLPRLWR
jgi:hypothetical protein